MTGSLGKKCLLIELIISDRLFRDMRKNEYQIFIIKKLLRIDEMTEWTPFKSDIEKFLKLCEIKNISRAAEKLGTTQSQLSKSIALLESQMQERLFIRKSQGVELTPFAEQMERNLLELQKNWQDKIESSLGTEVVGGYYSVGMHSSIAMRFFPEILHPLLKQYSHLNLRTELLPSLEVARKVAALQLDFGFVINPLKHPDLVAKKLSSETVGIWGKKVPHEGILYYHPDMFMVQKALKKFSRFRKVPLMDYEVIAQTLQSDEGAVGLLPDEVAKRYDKIKLLHGKVLEVNLNLIAHKDRLKSQSMKKLFQLLHA